MNRRIGFLAVVMVAISASCGGSSDSSTALTPLSTASDLAVAPSTVLLESESTGASVAEDDSAASPVQTTTLQTNAPASTDDTTAPATSTSTTTSTTLTTVPQVVGGPPISIELGPVTTDCAAAGDGAFLADANGTLGLCVGTQWIPGEFADPANPPAIDCKTSSDDAELYECAYVLSGQADPIDGFVPFGVGFETYFGNSGETVFFESIGLFPFFLYEDRANNLRISDSVEGVDADIYTSSNPENWASLVESLVNRGLNRADVVAACMAVLDGAGQRALWVIELQDVACA